MNGLDVILLLAFAAAIVGGWGMGFLRRLGGWIGVALGLALGLELLPRMIRYLGMESDLAVLIFGGLFLILVTSLSQAAGVAIGSRVRSGVGTSGVQRLDSVGGSTLGVLGVVAVAWIVFPVLAGTEGWPSQAARGSTITRALSQALPKPPPPVGRLERELAGGRFPRLFESVLPAPDVASPPPDVGFDQSLFDQSTRSVLKVESPACGRVQSGSGFFIDGNRAVTNAHVVAGSRQTSVTMVDGEKLAATVIHFDSDTDLAVLKVDGEAPALQIRSPSVGNQGIVMGFPGGGPFEPSTFAIAERVTSTGYDIYDSKRVERHLLVLSSKLAPGDSGSAVLRTDGAVIGMAVAIAPDKPSVAYALDSSEVTRVASEADDSPAETGPCI